MIDPKTLLVSIYLYFFELFLVLPVRNQDTGLFYKNLNDGESFTEFKTLQTRNIYSKLLTIDGSIEISYSPKTSTGC